MDVEHPRLGRRRWFGVMLLNSSQHNSGWLIWTAVHRIHHLYQPFAACIPVLDPSLLHAVLQVRGLIAEEHVTGAGGGVAGCRMELPFNITH